MPAPNARVRVGAGMSILMDGMSLSTSGDHCSGSQWLELSVPIAIGTGAPSQSLILVLGMVSSYYGVTGLA